MREPLAEAARTALQQGGTTTAQATADHLTVPADTPLVADVWINGDLGFVLLLHRRGDGLVAEELYYSVRREDGAWERPDHLSGGIVGTEMADPAAVKDALAGAPMSVVAESESLVHTGRDPNGDDGELVRISELLMSSEVDFIEIERLSPASPETSAPLRRGMTGPLTLLVLLPGERIRVSAMRGEDSSRARLGNALELHNREQ
ncbi:hypothetical protein E5082_29940 [Streptomyces griseoluteus]|uniref:Uncharacterized protein n=1 Tax=Streptomyces griseoluteus TaxID=29306 RepID=A0A4Z1CYF0_STRGP|nr:hypothetical protein [Streptomyces griseoluteus]TGN74342.1 hypothetical protein E5082_29940 [Streptomyces griseoluteus]